MTRHPDWPRRLEAAIEAARGRPFSWGAHDCVIFAAGVVRALTGEDPAVRWRGRYHGMRSAWGLMARNGGLATMVSRELGEPMHIKAAARGDVVLRCDAHGPALGVCLDHRAAFVSPKGLLFRPMSECVQAWRV